MAEPGIQFKVFFLGRHGEGYRAFFFWYSFLFLCSRVDLVLKITWPRQSMAPRWASLSSGFDAAYYHISRHGASEFCFLPGV